MFEHFGVRARAAVNAAAAAARELRHGDVGTEHILIGLLRGDGVASDVLRSMGVDEDGVHRQLLKLALRGTGPVRDNPRFTDVVTALFDRSLRESQVLGAPEVAPEHLLLAMGGGWSNAARIVKHLGADLAEAGAEVKSALLADALRARPPVARSGQEGRANRSGGGVFVCYRRQDTSHVAGRISDWLANHLGDDRVFIDVNSIQPGVNYREVIADAVARCDVLLAVIGPGWVGVNDHAGRPRLAAAHDLVRIEIETALRRGITVIPVLIDEAEMPPADRLPASLVELTYRNALRVRHDTFRLDVNRLLEAVRPRRRRS